MIKQKAARSHQLELAFSNFNIWLVIIVLVLVLFVVNSVLTFWWLIGGDIPVYHYFAQMIWGGAVPYRDLPLEYTPGVLPFILLAKPLGYIGGQYNAGFLLLSSLALVIFLKNLFCRQGVKMVVAFCALALPLMMFFFNCLDIFAALALYGAVIVFMQKKFDMSAILLAVSVLIKFYPIVCLPVFLMFLPRPMLKRFMAVFAGILIAGTLPFIIVSPSGFWHSITYHSGRPIQIESAPAAVGYVLHATGTHLNSFYSHKSFALQFHGSDVIATVSTASLLVGLLFFSYWLYRSKRSHNLALCCLPPLLIFIIFFKVGSPQYLVPVWLVGIVAIEGMPRPDKVRLLLRLFLISSAIYFTFSFYPHLIQLGGFAELLIIIRYILIAELLIWALRKINNGQQNKKA